MNIIALITVPLAAGVVSFFVRNNYLRRGLIIAASVIHLTLTCLVWISRPEGFFGGWFAFDDLGIVFLAVTSLLFLGASVYGVGYLSNGKQNFSDRTGGWELFSPEAVFTGCLLLFLSTMTMVIASQHLGVLWVAIEATTLASAPLIYFHRTKRSLEATWKYLLICSVGIALALLGIFFLATANVRNPGDLVLRKMVENAAQMDIPWLKAAFLFLFVGYGTKMGLAPFHTWLPDAHSEAPAAISALLSGALLNCAFLGILRGYQICAAAGLAAYCREIFIVFGLLSVLFAAVFILGQTDYKRMLAYSSVEHMGILTLGVGLGGGAVFGVMVNLVSHSLTKAGLFFIAGNILSHYRTKHISEVQGLITGRTRWTGVLWILGFLLITGTPPSGVFLGKFIILKEALGQGHYWITLVFLSALAVVFIGMAKIFISMTQGVPEKKVDEEPRAQNIFMENAPSAILFILVVVIGIYFPGWLTQALTGASRELGGL